MSARQDTSYPCPPAHRLPPSHSCAQGVELTSISDISRVPRVWLVSLLLLSSRVSKNVTIAVSGCGQDSTAQSQRVSRCGKGTHQLLLGVLHSTLIFAIVCCEAYYILFSADTCVQTLYKHLQLLLAV
jgi:hypothetical protein